jgi:phage gpG-like protein
MPSFDDIDKLAQHLLNKVDTVDFSPAFGKIKQVVQTSIDRNFSEGGRFGSEKLGGGTEKWLPSKRAKKQSGKTLTDTGQLAASIRVAITQQGKQVVIEVGSNKAYAAIHQFGGVVDVPAHSATSKLARKTDKETGKTSVRFAKRKRKLSKNVTSRTYTIGAYSFTLPARPFLVLQDEDLTAIRNILVAHIIKTLKT